jgi:hypothetical protein
MVSSHRRKSTSQSLGATRFEIARIDPSYKELGSSSSSTARRRVTVPGSAPTTPEEVARRAGGCRHYNCWRQAQALIRRSNESRLLREYPHFKRGTVSAIAKKLGVHRSTVCRDLKALRRLARPCRHCGAFPIVGPDLDLIEATVGTEP